MTRVPVYLSAHRLLLDGPRDAYVVRPQAPGEGQLPAECLLYPRCIDRGAAIEELHASPAAPRWIRASIRSYPRRAAHIITWRRDRTVRTFGLKFKFVYDDVRPERVYNEKMAHPRDYRVLRTAGRGCFAAHARPDPGCLQDSVLHTANPKLYVSSSPFPFSSALPSPSRPPPRPPGPPPSSSSSSRPPFSRAAWRGG